MFAWVSAVYEGAASRVVVELSTATADTAETPTNVINTNENNKNSLVLFFNILLSSRDLQAYLHFLSVMYYCNAFI